MQIKKISLNCNHILTLLSFILFIVIIFKNPEINEKTLKVIESL